MYFVFEFKPMNSQFCLFWDSRNCIKVKKVKINPFLKIWYLKFYRLPHMCHYTLLLKPFEFLYDSFQFCSFQWFKKLGNYLQKILNKSYTSIASTGVWIVFWRGKVHKFLKFKFMSNIKKFSYRKNIIKYLQKQDRK